MKFLIWLSVIANCLIWLVGLSVILLFSSCLIQEDTCKLSFSDVEIYSNWGDGHEEI